MLYFTIQNRLQDGTSKVSEAAGARWRFCVRIMLGYRRISSDILESSFYWRKHVREFPLKSWASRFRGRRSIWWCWRATLLAPRIGNDFLSCDADHWWHSFCVAGAVFGEVGGWLFVAGAALRDILGDRRRAKCCILQYKIVSKMGRVRSPKRRVRDDDFVFGLSSDYARIILELSSNRLSIGGSIQGVSAEVWRFQISWQAHWKEVKSQTHHPKSHDITAMQRQKLRSNPKKNLGHRNGRSSCAHSIGKFFLCYMVLFSFETSATGSPGNYLYYTTNPDPFSTLPLQILQAATYAS